MEQIDDLKQVIAAVFRIAREAIDENERLYAENDGLRSEISRLKADNKQLSEQLQRSDTSVEKLNQLMSKAENLEKIGDSVEGMRQLLAQIIGVIERHSASIKDTNQSIVKKAVDDLSALVTKNITSAADSIKGECLGQFDEESLSVNIANRIIEMQQGESQSVQVNDRSQSSNEDNTGIANENNLGLSEDTQATCSETDNDLQYQLADTTEPPNASDCQKTASVQPLTDTGNDEYIAD